MVVVGRRRDQEEDRQHDRAAEIQQSEQDVFRIASAQPAGEPGAEDVHAADGGERGRAQHRILAADREIIGQMRGQENQLQAADEICAAHHQKAPVAHARRQAPRASSRAFPPGAACGRRRRPGKRAGSIATASNRKNTTPTCQFQRASRNCSRWRDHQRADRGARADHTQNRAAPLGRHRARGGRHRQRGRGAGQRDANQSARNRQRRRAAGRQHDQHARRHKSPRPASIAGRRPHLSAIAPTGACDRPQAMFCTATAKVKSAALIARSCVTGGRNRPRLCRIPIPILIMTAAPVRIRTGFGRRAVAIVWIVSSSGANVPGSARQVKAGRSALRLTHGCSECPHLIQHRRHGIRLRMPGRVQMMRQACRSAPTPPPPHPRSATPPPPGLACARRSQSRSANRWLSGCAGSPAPDAPRSRCACR